MKEKLTKKERVQLKGLVSKYGQKSLLEAINYKKIFPYILTGGLMLGGMKTINNHYIPTEKAQSQYVSSQINKYNENLFQEKLDAVVEMMDKVLHKTGRSIDDISFNPENVVRLCREYDFDLPLMLAQMQCESHFGTDSKARSTGSVLSIGLYDDGRVLARYDNQDDCFEPYIRIMQRDYLQNGAVSVDDLLENGKFVNKLGKRYAKNEKYERDIRITRNKIMKDYPVLAQKYLTDENV